VRVSGQVDHPGDSTLGVADPGWPPDVLIDAKDFDSFEAAWIGHPPGRLGLDRVPAGVPVHTEVAGQRGDGGVVEGQRVGRPPGCPRSDLRPGRHQVVAFGEHAYRAGRLSAAPQPGQPHQAHWDTEHRGVRHGPAAASVTDREHPARRAAADISVGLDG